MQRDGRLGGATCLFLLGACLLSGCDEDSESAADAEVAIDAGQDAGPQSSVCDVVAPTSCAEPAPRFNDILPIITQRCTPCHRGDWSGPWPLDDYHNVSDWQDSVRSHLLECSMPPPEAGMPLPKEESMRILQWIRCGALK